MKTNKIYSLAKPDFDCNLVLLVYKLLTEKK